MKRLILVIAGLYQTCDRHIIYCKLYNNKSAINNVMYINNKSFLMAKSIEFPYIIKNGFCLINSRFLNSAYTHKKN